MPKKKGETPEPEAIAAVEGAAERKARRAAARANAEFDPVADAMPPEKPPENPHYDTGQWHHKTMFKCNYCPWSTLGEDEMIKHIANHLSGGKPNVRRTDTGLVNESGNKIVREEIVGPDEE